jgi:hypothetical protein
MYIGPPAKRRALSGLDPNLPKRQRPSAPAPDEPWLAELPFRTVSIKSINLGICYMHTVTNDTKL